ncbi:MAG: ComF family protein [Granulosicoccaceae bacterium]
MVNICSNFVQFILPRYCQLCGMAIGPGHHDARLGLCRGCIEDLPWLAHSCSGCGVPLASSGAGMRCGLCQQHPPPFDRTHAVWRYATPLDALICRMKFHNDPAIAETLGKLLAISLAAHPLSRPDAILPVPLHPRRLRQRGFNQALQIARPVARRLQLPLLTRHCHRRRDTQAQSDLPLHARRANMRGAFVFRRPVTARHVAIVDDVMTSGHTVAELCRQLRRQGVEEISVWCCARTVN